MIIRSRTVVPMEGEPIENGAVAVEGNRIVSVGRFEEVKANHGAEILDLGEQILLPGLINGHCHLDYTMLRGQIPPQESFTDWISAINAHKAALQDDDYLTAIANGLAEAQNFGTTTLVNLEAFPELLPRLPRPSLRTWWCVEMIDVRRPASVGKVANHLFEWFQSHPEYLGGIGLAPHAPYTASAQLYSDSSAISGKQLLLTTHLAESHEEMQMFRDASGPLFEFLKSIGRPMDDCG
jgi:cytosine/adenosine deaminase-related metal-dependent hydrolase